MAYINARGEIVDRPAFSWTNPISILWAILNFISLFFQTLFPSDGSTARNGGRGGRRGDDGRGPPGMRGVRGLRGSAPSSPPACMGGG